MGTDSDTFITTGSKLEKDHMASSTPSIHMKSSTDDGIIGSSSQSIHVKTDRDDDIIGFDIKLETEEEKERRILADKALWKPAPAPFELPEPPRTEKKVITVTDTPRTVNVREPEPVMTSEQRQKEIRGNFIKDWQKDLKEFFSLGKSKKKEKSSKSSKSSLSSKTSSMTLEQADSWTNGEPQITYRSDQCESQEEPTKDSMGTVIKVEDTGTDHKMGEE